MKKDEQEKFIEKQLEYEKDKILTTQEVNKTIQEIEEKIRKLNFVDKKEKKELEKQLNAGREIIKQINEPNLKKKYELWFFYDKKVDTIILKNIVEYEKEEKSSYIFFDYIITFYTVLFIYFISKESTNKFNNLLIFSLLVIGLILNILTSCFYKKEKNDQFRINGRDWLDKLLLEIDGLRKIEKFRILRTIFFFLLFLVYSSLIMINGVEIYILVINIMFYIYILFMFIINLLKLAKFNFFYFVGIIFIALLAGSLQSTNWEAIVALIAIIGLLFSDEIWKLYPNYNNPLESKYQSKNNKKIVERNIFKYKLILSVISLILFVVLKSLKDRIILGEFLIGKEVEKANYFTLLMYKGLDRIVIAFVLFILYLAIVEWRKRRLRRGKEFEKPIVDIIVKYIYKDIKLCTPVVKSSIEIDMDLAKIFEPKTLIKNLDDLPEDIIVNMEKPVKNGKNILFIQYSDGKEFLKKEINIELKKR